MMQSIIIIAVAFGFILFYHFVLKKTMSQQKKVLEAFERFVGVNVLYQTFDGDLHVELSDAQAHAVNLLSQAIINIPRPSTIPDETLPNDGKWVYMPNGALAVLQDNLIVNGFGELGGKVNFSKFEPHVQDEFAELGLAANYIGERAFVTDSKAVIMTDSLIAVDPTKVYSLSLLVGTFPDNGEDCSFEVGVAFFDADGVLIEKNFIAPENSNSLLRLASNLEVGDTYMVVNSVPTFAVANGQRNLAFMRHNFKNGKASSQYSRNILMDAYPQSSYYSVVSNEKRIALSQPWAGDTVQSGVKIKNVFQDGFHGAKINNTQTGVDVRAYTLSFGGVGGFFGSFNISSFARYMKFYVKQLGVEYYQLLVADVKLQQVFEGTDIAPKGVFIDSVVPAYAAFELPNGYRYWTGTTMYEALDGQWVSRGYTVLPNQ
jgi:hypothetical protein